MSARKKKPRRVPLKKVARHANVTAIRNNEETVFGMRTGLFGHPTTTVLRIADEKVVGAIEDPSELGEIVTQLGMLTAAALFNYNLAFGTEGLAEAMAKWAGIDVAALRAAEAVTEEVDEDGDVIVRTAEEAEDPLVDLGGEG
jgi:hypothetical protein